MLLRDWAWIKRVSMWNSSPVPKTGQILKESSIYQMVIKKRMGLVCIDKMTIVALKVPSYKANERGVWHPESKNRSTVKARFRHPMTNTAWAQTPAVHQNNIKGTTSFTCQEPLMCGQLEGLDTLELEAMPAQ